uniref:Fatty acid synthase 2 n=1 Tax=Callorhinchus milii TaxID=7868 RepID=A0A4W3GF71_CALMI
MRTKRASLIEGFNDFDYKLFGINNTEANCMDPQHKLLLECTYRALENAGMPQEDLSGSKTGVFIGLMNRDFEAILNNSANRISHYNGTGTAMSIAANRISFTFNFTGPSLAIDTACSSSLVALHYASQAIKQGDCEMAVCGGVSCIIEPCVNVVLSKAKMISPDGMCKPFSKKADGYGRGEGCGILLLKPLAKALKDNDHIWGVLVHSAINQDGRSVTPITRPSQTQQEELLKWIYHRYVDPSQIQYMEAHGTGTPAGDPTEAGSISHIVGQSRTSNPDPLIIGSVKGNVGHTESAAGAAGLIKVLLMMHHGKIVPSLHYTEEDSSINAKALNLRVPTSVENWEERGEMGRMAGVNSFGFGGTNAHAVVRQYKQLARLNCAQKPLEIFVLSAASQKSIQVMIKDTSKQISQSDDTAFHSLAYTSACRRSHASYRYRKAFVVSSLNHLQQQLKSATVTDVGRIKTSPKIVFVFCGNGVAYRGMCKLLVHTEPVFRTQIEEIEKILQLHTPINLIDLIENDYDDFTKPEIAQPLLFAVQVAMVSLLGFWGIQANLMIGHSVGEVAAAHCAGTLSLHDAVKVIYYRSVLQSTVTGGRMLAVSNLPVSNVSDRLVPYSGRLCIAAFNSPSSCTVSGDAGAVDKLYTELSTAFGDKNIFLRILDVPAAYHSHLMEPIIQQVEEKVGNLHEQEARSKVISTVTGQVASGDDFLTGKYWARNIRDPVAFEKGIRAAAAEAEDAVFVEIGPRRALQRYITEILGNQTRVFPAVQPDRDYETHLLVLSKLFELGYNPNWQNVYVGRETLPTVYPCYVFDHTKQELNFEELRQDNDKVVSSHHPLLSSVSKDGKEYNFTLSTLTVPYVAEHKNNGVPILPGAFYVELGVASVLASIEPKIPLTLCRISAKFLKPCIIHQNSVELKVHLNREDKLIKFSVLSSSGIYATGEILQVTECVTDESNISVEQIFQRCKSKAKPEDIYKELSSLGFQYGSVFRQLGDIFYGENLKEAITCIRVPEELMSQIHQYSFHPIILDYFLQMAAVVTMMSAVSSMGFPTSVGSLVIHRPLQQEMLMYLRISKITPDYLEVCGGFTDTKGIIIAELKNIRTTFLTMNNGGGINDLFYESIWVEIPHLQEGKNLASGPRSLVFGDNYGVAESLKKFWHSQSTYIPYQEYDNFTGTEVVDLLRKYNVHDLNSYEEVFFLWGTVNLTDQTSTAVVQEVSSCCEIYRQIIQLVRGKNGTKSVRVITYRTSEKTVDQITPGFALWGMTRSCSAEIPEVLFQIIDVSSVSDADMAALANVIVLSDGVTHPEVMISQGMLHASTITRTSLIISDNTNGGTSYSGLGNVLFQIMDPYNVVDLHAKPQENKMSAPTKQSVHIELDAICMHSADYFPVSVSDLNYGKTLYWSKSVIGGHNLVALDFSGTVTAVGSDVKSCKVGDHIVACYPVPAASNVSLPAVVCFKSKKVPLLEIPCVSYFTIAWEILHNLLPKPKHQKRLVIVSMIPDSCLSKVLSLTARESGWRVQVHPDSNNFVQIPVHFDALVLLPPLEKTSISKYVNGSSARDIVVLLDNKQMLDISQDILQNEKDNVCIHVLQLASIFQKGYLMKSANRIYKWMRTMYLGTKRFDLSKMIFQQRISDMVECRNESYFTCRGVSIAVLKSTTKTRMSEIPMHCRQKQLFKSDAVYIVAGGLTGLGFETVKFIANHGGGYILVLSRSSPSKEKQEEFSKLQNEIGTRIICVACDISALSNVEKAISNFLHSFPKVSVKGVFHSAVVLHDSLFEDLNKSLFDKVLVPKIAGVLNLHYATQGLQLEYFVCFSSIASFFGSSLQANYSAANSFLDYFVHFRRCHGLVGQSVNWGALNLGLLLNKDNVRKFLELKGILAIEISEIIESFERCLTLNNPQQVICKFDFSNIYVNVSQNPSSRRRFHSIVQEEISKGNVKVVVSDSSISPEQYIITLLSEVSNTDPTDFTKESTLSSFGIDSMIGMTIQNRIHQEKNVSVPLVTFLDPKSTVSTLVSLFEEEGFQVHSGETSMPLNKSFEEVPDEFTQL